MAGGRLGETDESIVEFGISIPVPLLDSSKGLRTEAAARVSVAQAELEAVRQALRRQWTIASRRYRTAGTQVASYRDHLLPKAGEALRLVQLGFEEGKFGFIDLLDTQIQSSSHTPEWTETLKQRRNALLPYCGKTLLKGRLEIGKDAYWIKVDTETKAVIYWERYENWSDRLKR